MRISYKCVYICRKDPKNSYPVKLEGRRKHHSRLSRDTSLRGACIGGRGFPRRISSCTRIYLSRERREKSPAISGRVLPFDSVIIAAAFVTAAYASASPDVRFRDGARIALSNESGRAGLADKSLSSIGVEMGREQKLLVVPP